MITTNTMPSALNVIQSNKTATATTPATQIWQGDAFAMLPMIPAGSIDAIITDPPYGTTAAEWDVNIDFAELFKESWRVLKPNGVIAMFAQMPLAARLACMQPQTFRYQWVWHKTQAVGMLNANRMPLRAHELILIFYRKLPTYNRVPLDNQRGKPYHHKQARAPRKTSLYRGAIITGKGSADGTRCPRDVITFARDSQRWGHPTQKPLELMRYLVKQYTNPGDIVLDPFCGCGSTLAAAQAEGRRSIGIELDPAFAATTRRRLIAQS